MYKLLLSTALAAAAAPAWASDAADADDAPAEIVVTADVYGQPLRSIGSKTGTDLRDVPASIAVIPQSVLEDQDVRSLDAALTNASAVAPTFGGSYGFADNYVIRGLPMRFLRDGLPDGSTFNGYRRTLADIASVEVLKGPGSALYGRAEAGGSVNLSTLQPEEAFGLRGVASYGRFDTITLTGDLTGPLAEGASARLIGNYERTDGYRGLGRRFIDILPTVAVELGRNRLVFDYDHRDQRLVVDNYGIPFTTARTLANVRPDARFYSPFNRTEQTINRFTVSNSFAARDDLTLRAAFIYDLREIALARNAGGNPINAAGVMTGRNGRTQNDDARYVTGQAEAVWSPVTGGIKHTLLLGAEYQSIDIDTVRRNYALPNASIVNGAVVLSDPSVVPAATTLAFDRQITSDTLSVYAQEQLDFGLLKLRVGGRYDSVKLVDQGVFNSTRARIAGSNGLFSWQAGAVLQPTGTLSFYGGYSRGEFLSIQTESANLSSNFARLAPPAPERSSQIELGFKSEPLPGLLQVNGAAFRTKRDNFFVTLVPGGDPVQVGRQRSQGIELDLVGTPLPGLSIIANAAYVDAVNRSNALVSVAGVATNQSSFGKRLASTPRYSGSLWANYEVQGGVLQGLSIGAGAVYKSAAFVDALELFQVPAYTVYRAALGYRVGPVEAQLTVANLTNKLYYTTPTFIGALPGDPRSVQFTLRTRL